MFSKQGFITVCLVILTALLLTGCQPTTPTPVAVTGVTLDQATMTLIAGGATGTLVATAAPADATNKSVTWSSSADDLYWSSSEYTPVATVANGVVTPLIAGTTTITVTTVDGGFTATCAVTVNPAGVVGDSYGGGIVAYILVDGDTGYDASEQHGLIAATADQSIGIQWYHGSYVVTGATDTAIGTGQANTTAIVTIQGAGSYAAQLCNDLTEGGYDDWFLPSKDELNKLYINKNAIGGFTASCYWSSSEYYANSAWWQSFYNAWLQNFYDGNQHYYYENPASRVRAVRAF